MENILLQMCKMKHVFLTNLKIKTRLNALAWRKVQKYKDVEPIQYNFYEDETLEESFELLCDEIALNKSSDYFKAFMSVDCLIETEMIMRLT